MLDWHELAAVFLLVFGVNNLGSCATNFMSASTPPAEAPTTTMSR